MDEDRRRPGEGEDVAAHESAVALGQAEPIEVDTLGGGRSSRRGDRIFAGLSRGMSIFLLVVIAGIAVFLLIRSIPALRADTANFLTTKTWFPDSTPSVFGIAALAWGTLLSSVLALVMAVPVAVGIALFIAHYAPRRLASTLGYLVDLLAAVPSVIYGLWGRSFLVGHMLGISHFLSHHFGWIPLFTVPAGSTYRNTMFNAGVVLAVMILPIISAVSREVFLQVPRAHIEAALALGLLTEEQFDKAVRPDEFARMKSHVYYTYYILSSVSGLEEIAEIAGNHHERRGGTGYPNRFKAEELSIGAKIMILSDVFSALVEDRPYRNGMGLKEIWSVIGQLSSDLEIDEEHRKTIRENIHNLYEHILQIEESIRHFYKYRLSNIV